MIASDSLPSTGLHDFHLGDVYNPIDPASLLTRLQTVGFGAITISVDHALTFRARKPDVADANAFRPDWSQPLSCLKTPRNPPRVSAVRRKVSARCSATSCWRSRIARVDALTSV